ncbi:MAG TPA: phosphatidylinositol-specific phospholipase C/glycerophosphodiester phosphodiesterase family protein [bacterium]
MIRALSRGTTRVVVVVLALSVAGSVTAAPDGIVPLARAHAHNDYLHPRPLLDALDAGFTSVEADVWLVDGELFVAHDRSAIRPARTLRTLYLEPLRRIVREHDGHVHRGYPYPVILLVDIKSEAEATYRVLDTQLSAYRPMLTAMPASGVRLGAVLVIVSGNRPRDFMLGQTERLAGYDGRSTDLGGPLASSFMPLVSDNWMLRFAWMGIGPMPEDERRRLAGIVAAAHDRGQRVRFWATPDSGPGAEAVWTVLLRAGVDYINADRLAALRAFLLRMDPSRSQLIVR